MLLVIVLLFFILFPFVCLGILLSRTDDAVSLIAGRYLYYGKTLMPFRNMILFH